MLAVSCVPVGAFLFIPHFTRYFFQIHRHDNVWWHYGPRGGKTKTSGREDFRLLFLNVYNGHYRCTELIKKWLPSIFVLVYFVHPKGVFTVLLI